MFIIKKKYFLIVENIKDIDLKKIKKRNKFFIIYRNNKKNDKFAELFRFRQICKSKAIKFYVANDLKLALSLNSDGVYLSSYNKELKFLNYKKLNFDIIGSAHNLREISEKIKQGCKLIFLSRLFLVNYDNNSTYLGIVKFNKISKFFKNIIPLGGIKSKNLKKLKNVFCDGFALLTEVKKKPAITSRLFKIDL